MSSKEEFHGYVSKSTDSGLKVKRDGKGDDVPVTGMVYDMAKKEQATTIGTRVIITINDSEFASTIRLESPSGPSPRMMSYREHQLAFGGTTYEPGTGICNTPQPLSAAGPSGRGGYAAASGTPSSSGGGVNTPERSAASGRGGYASSSGGGVNTPGSSAASKDGGS